MNRGSIQTGIWLIGLGILFLTGYWWPGILILIGASMIAETLVRSGSKPEQLPTVPIEVDKSDRQAEGGPEEPIPLALGEMPDVQAATQQHSTARLPDRCPMCGGSVLAFPENLEWTGYDSALCPYCSTPLPLPSAPQ